MKAMVLAGVALALVGCAGAKARYTSAAVAPQAEAPQPLERSLFSRDPNGELSEDRIQEILAAELELELPARIGVLPVVDAVDWRGPGPSYEMAPAALVELVKGLRGSEPFTHVTEMLSIPSGALGMEALREIAARYQLRYILLYRERMLTRERANAWAIGYATLVGALFLPGDTLQVNGYVEASLLDVKTGILAFTVRRRVMGHRETNVWHTGDKLEDMQLKAALAAAPELAADVRKAVHQFSAAARLENERKARDAAEAAAAAPAPPPATAAAVAQ
jgi:rhombotail lipoprotein